MQLHTLGTVDLDVDLAEIEKKKRRAHSHHFCIKYVLSPSALVVTFLDVMQGEVQPPKRRDAPELLEIKAKRPAISCPVTRARTNDWPPRAN